MHVKRVLSLCVYFFIVSTISANQTNNKRIKQFFIDIGGNLTITCPETNGKEVMWVREGREDEQKTRLTIKDDGSLFLMGVDENDTGTYACMPANTVGDDRSAKMNVTVRTPPPEPIDVRVHPSTILAVILWGVNGTGGHPIIYFSAQYRQINNDTWLDVTPIHISPNTVASQTNTAGLNEAKKANIRFYLNPRRQIDVYKLRPNTTYAFRIWAHNILGDSNIVEVESTTTISNVQAQLERHLLEGVKNFDTRVWVIAVAIVMGTLVILGFGTCFLLYQECRMPSESDDQEVIELVPNIILNPGFEGNTTHSEHLPPDENSNNETAIRLNNNTVVQQRNNL